LPNVDLGGIINNSAILSVHKPGRYVGREPNIIIKEGLVDFTIALAFPDVYEVGMSHVGLKILYHLLNTLPGVQAERVFVPWPDMGKLMRQRGIPLYSLERKLPVVSFDLLGISLQHELNYTNVLYLLDLAGIPFYSEERGDNFPLIVGGGPCAFNPEPLAPFFDFFFIGEAEEGFPEIVRVLREVKGEPKENILRLLSHLEGVYVPAFRKPVKKRWVQNLDAVLYPSTMVVPYVSIIHDRIPIEISRGCTRGCRFCQAGIIYRPRRERSPQKIVELAQSLVDTTGYEEVSLVSLSSTDYSSIDSLLRALSLLFGPRKVNISLPSLRMDAFSVEIAKELQKVRKSGLTFAPEAGNERLRAVINKHLKDEEILSTVEKAFTSGWEDLKLYFMIGLPEERDTDVGDIARLVAEILRVGKACRGKKVDIHLSIAAFIPKPHTPFQWVAQERRECLNEKMKLLTSRLRTLGKSVRFHWSCFEMSAIEALLARGDARLAKVIERVYRRDGFMEGWSEFFDGRRWEEALQEEGLSLDEYVYKPGSFEEPFPWDWIDCGVRKELLWREYEKARRGEFTPSCWNGFECSQCGVCS